MLDEIPDSKLRKISPDNRVNVLYQGQINERTSVQALTDFAIFAPERFHLHLAGPVQPEYFTQIQDLNKNGMLTYHGFIRGSELPRLRQKCDVGLITWKSDPAIPLSIKYTTPTKLYEYIASGMPVIFMPNYSVLKLNEELSFGLMVWDHSWEALAEGLEQLTSDAAAFEKQSEHNLFLFRSRLNFEKQITGFAEWLERKYHEL